MPIRFPVLAALLLATPAAAPIASEAAGAAAPPRSDWSITVGAGVLTLPTYPGAASSTVMPLPFVEVKYRQKFFLSSLEGLGFHAIATQRLQTGFAVLPDFGRSASASDRLRGWGDVGAGANIRAFARYSLGPASLLAARVALRRANAPRVPY